MIKKVLVANRGEIACRIMRTTRKLGINSVAVFSDADRHSLHVREADEAVHIGPSASSSSYLVGSKIIDAARRTGATAIHPGYGFLSENASFARLVSERGLTWVGPPAESIEAMGHKAASKALMVDAGVPVVPGYHGAAQDAATLRAEAEKTGFPLMIKAVLGGGGKGMRIVRAASDFDSDLDACRREALASFGDDHVLLERYIGTPRHVEVQVFCDAHGQGVYLFERDCSVQRRHQKVLEEAPAPALRAGTRTALGEAAVRAALAVGYRGAGTVEFIVDAATEEFFFMEMNTRLQVEHPVTEMVTGVDLVEWQLRVAAGEPLPLLQPQLRCTGHAFEARVYAEAPQRGFLPGAGPLEHASFPPDARVETGVEEGDEVSIHYDPMIAKVVVAGADRAAALGALRRALAGVRLAGLRTNVDFLRACCAHPRFEAGGVDTSFIDQHRDELFPRQGADAEVLAAAAAALLALESGATKENSGAFRVAGASAARALRLREAPWAYLQEECKEHELEARQFAKDGVMEVDVEGQTRHVRVLEPPTRENRWALRVEVDGRGVKGTAVLTRKGAAPELTLFLGERTYHFELPKLVIGDAAAGKRQDVVAPMPGKVVKVLVVPGKWVEKGEPLCVVMAMKMEHTIKATHEGEIEAVLVKGDQQVDADQILLKFKKEEE